MNLIISEAQAERIGEQRTGGKRNSEFVVFTYPHRQTKLTAFGVEIIATGEIIAVA